MVLSNVRDRRSIFWSILSKTQPSLAFSKLCKKMYLRAVGNEIAKYNICNSFAYLPRPFTIQPTSISVDDFFPKSTEPSKVYRFLSSSLYARNGPSFSFNFPVLACARKRAGSDRRRQTTVWYGARKDHQNVNRDTGAAGPTRRRNVLSSVNESLCHLLFVSNSPRSCALGRWNFNFARSRRGRKQKQKANYHVRECVTSCPIHRLIYFQGFHHHSPGPSRTNASFVSSSRSLMFSRATIAIWSLREPMHFIPYALMDVDSPRGHR